MLRGDWITGGPECRQNMLGGGEPPAGSRARDSLEGVAVGGWGEPGRFRALGGRVGRTHEGLDVEGEKDGITRGDPVILAAASGCLKTANY